LTVGSQSLFGLSVDGLTHPASQASVALVVFAVCAWVVSNLRRGAAGRRLIAVRDNERAAASLGVNGREAKLYAFGLASAIAGVGGIMLAFAGETVLYSQTFDPSFSITAVTLAVLGSIGFVLGPLFGSTLAQGGIPGGIIADHIGNGGNWLLLVGGVVLLLTLVLNPNGLAAANIRLFGWATRGLRKEGVASTALPRLFGWATRGRRKEGVASTTLPRRTTRRQASGASLAIRGLSVQFGAVTALSSVDLDIRAGEVVGLIGPNGAGKTTLVDAVTGFVSTSSGTIKLDDQAIHTRKAFQRARLGVTRSFQSLELFEDVTVLDNLRAASDTRQLRLYLSDLVRPKPAELSEAAIEAIHEFKLHDELDKRPHELPYGKRRLVAIARAVASDAKILLLDEPAAGLSQQERRELAELIRKLADDWNLGVLLIEHDVSVVMSTCDRVAVLDFGRKIADGTPDIVRRDPAVVAAYLGAATPDDDPSKQAALSGAQPDPSPTP
jgi:ABC-type branched-subunit amino acid transport system ATPase component